VRRFAGRGLVWRAGGTLAIGATLTVAVVGGLDGGAGNPAAAVDDAALTARAHPVPAATGPGFRATSGRPAAARAEASAHGAPPSAATTLPYGVIDRVDLGPDDAQADAGIIDRPSISADGRYVAFASLADNLARDGHHRSQVFVRDRLTRRTNLVSATRTGSPGGDSSSAPAISGDGRWVAFESYAHDLAPGAVRTGIQNVFLRDLATGRTTLLSAAPGRAGNGDSGAPTIDAAGERVAFESRADDLVPDDHNGHANVFVWDRASNSIRRASLDGAGTELPTGSGAPSISADGTRVAFILAGTRGGDCQDAYVKDLTSGALTLASVATDSAGGCGTVQDVTLSGDGRHVAFATSWPLSPAARDSTLEVYLRDLSKGTTTMVSTPQPRRMAEQLPGIAEVRAESYGPSLSRDGRWVAFTSFADDLSTDHVARTNNAYLKDMATGTVRMIAAVAGRPLPTGSSYAAVITPDAAHVAFASSAQNLVPNQNNHAEDLFVIDRSGARYAAATTRPTLPVVPPRTLIDGGPTGTVAAGEQRFVLLSDTDPVRFQCRFDSGPWHWCGKTVSWRIGRGAHTLWARAVDLAGNVDQAPASRVFRVR